MNTLAKQLVISLINAIPQGPKGRPYKMPIDHYVDVIFKVLKSGMRWSDITDKLHYKSYYQTFIKWSKQNVFSNAHIALMKILETGNFFKHTNQKDLVIDASMFKNALGIDNTGRNHYDRNRKASKVTVIVTFKGIILGATVNKGNVHDSQLVFSTLDNIQIKILKSRLLADRGYNSKPLKKELKKRKIHLIYPYKKNQGNQAPFETDKLKNRFIVEHSFAWIKQYRRLNHRYDRLSHNFEQFLYMAILNINCNKLDKMEKI